MDETELMQTGVGVLTEAYHMYSQQQDGRPDDESSGGLAMLLNETLRSRLSVTSSEECQAEVQRAVQEVADTLVTCHTVVMQGMIHGFVAVAYNYSRACPNVDIAHILQQTSLSILDLENDE